MAEGVFFQDLAILMAVAGVVAALFSRFGWPKVLGYILAGVLLNGHTWGGSILADVASTRTAGQLGIVFLMFGMGLSFSPKDVRRVRSVAVPAAIVDTAVMTWAGYTVVYKTPQGYYVDDSDVEEFDRGFPPKQKLKLPGQLF